ncbi:MAG: glutamate--tRNA ligase, partial [Candidatus Dormibacteraceae bacterium]
ARLLAAGSAYRCFCTREELDQERAAATAAKLPYRYSRRCLHQPPAGRTEFVVRLLVPAGKTRFTDLVRGDLEFDNDLIGDPVLVRSDGVALYNFSSPIDDALMEISHVIRGEEHLSNTPVQLMVLDALGYQRPTAFAHLPVIVGKDRAKLSKRRHPEARLGLYREMGYLPEALLNYLALLGWNPGTEEEIFSLPELVDSFRLERVQRASAMFDWEKLDWVNAHYIRSLSDDDLSQRLLPFLPDLPPATVRAAAPALKERLPRLAQAAELLAFLKEAPTPPDLDPGQRQMLELAGQVLAATSPWTPQAIETALETLREARQWSRGKLFTPIRRAVAGSISPPLHHTLALLDQAEALARMERSLHPVP